MKMRSMIFTLLAAIMFFSCSHSKPLKGTVIDEFSIDSEHTGISYPVHVYLPPGYDESDTQYPVYYWTNGQWYFHNMARVLERLKIKAVLVSVGQGGINRRMVDYMRPGAEPYFRFFKEELLPYIEKRYRIDADDRTLCGAVSGGSFVAQALVLDTAETPLCKNYFIFEGNQYWYYPEGKWRMLSNDGHYYAKLFREMYKKTPELDIRIVLTYSSVYGNEQHAKWFFSEIGSIGFKKLKLTKAGFKVPNGDIAEKSFEYALKEEK